MHFAFQVMTHKVSVFIKEKLHHSSLVNKIDWSLFVSISADLGPEDLLFSLVLNLQWFGGFRALVFLTDRRLIVLFNFFIFCWTDLTLRYRIYRLEILLRYWWNKTDFLIWCFLHSRGRNLMWLLRSICVYWILDHWVRLLVNGLCLILKDLLPIILTVLILLRGLFYTHHLSLWGFYSVLLHHRIVSHLRNFNDWVGAITSHDNRIFEIINR